jgi:endonuclease/exonuclease/phosphatase (EEP) superfamily protein YafD
MLILLRALTFLAMAGITAIIVAGFFGAVHPAFDTLSNFRLHLAVLLIALAALWAFRYNRLVAAAYSLAGLAAVATSLPGLPAFHNQVQAARSGETYRLFSMNLYWANPAPGMVIEKIMETDPDFVFLVEYSKKWQRRISKLDWRYPYQSRCPTSGNRGGSVILSKFPFSTGRDYCAEYASLALREVEIEGSMVTLGVVHQRWPWPASGPRLIDAQLPELRSIGGHAIIAGDFNSVTWSHSLQRFADAGKLAIVENIGATWGPSLTVGGHDLQFPQRLGLPIDNVMVGGGVRVIHAGTLNHLGSDHLPTLVDFELR